MCCWVGYLDIFCKSVGGTIKDIITDHFAAALCSFEMFTFSFFYYKVLPKVPPNSSALTNALLVLSNVCDNLFNICSLRNRERDVHIFLKTNIST